MGSLTVAGLPLLDEDVDVIVHVSHVMDPDNALVFM